MSLLREAVPAGRGASDGPRTPIWVMMDFEEPLTRAATSNSRTVGLVPVVFYNAHFIIRTVATEIPGGIKVIPTNQEKYVSFSKYIDGCKISFRFVRSMAASLDELTSYLDAWITIRSPDANWRISARTTKKSALPYDYLSSLAKLEDPQLPSKEAFENILTAVRPMGWRRYDCSTKRRQVGLILIHHVFRKQTIIVW